MDPRALLRPMRLYAAALATLLLLAPAALLLADDAPAAPARDGPLGKEERPPPAARYDATYLLNDTRIRAPTLPDWPASEACLLLESWGGTTITAGGLSVTWSASGLGGAEILELVVDVPGEAPRRVMGGSPMEMRLDGLVVHEGAPVKVALRAAEDGLLVVRQEATVRAGWDMTGGPLAVQTDGCS